MRQRPNEEDIRAIYCATIDELFDFVARRCHGDVKLAEDITQETWLRAVDDWGVGRRGIPERPIAWLTRVASRLLSNHRRHEAVERVVEDDPDTLIDDDDDGAERRERRSFVQRALEQLPVAQARLVERFYFERRPVAEIAAADGLTERAVEGRLRRVRERLRGLMRRDFQRSDDR